MKNSTTTPKILANVSVIKLREYSKSYGAPQTLNYAFLKEFSNEIILLNEQGRHIRTMRKGTKLLISFSGTEISEKAYKMRVKKALEIEAIEKEEQSKITELNRIAKEKEDAKIMQEMAAYFTDAKIAEIKEKLKTKNSKGCKNYYKMKSIQLTGTHNNWDLIYKSIFG